MMIRFFLTAVAVVATIAINQWSNSAWAGQPTPTDCLKSFMYAIYSAKELKDVEQYFCKPMRDSFKTMTPAQRQEKLKELKNYYLANVTYGEEKVSGKTASVAARGTGYQPSVKRNTSQKERFDFVQENNYWRISGARLEGTYRL